RWLAASGATLGSLWLTACNKLSADPTVAKTLARAEGFTKATQRALTDRKALAKEFTPADISGDFRPNGSINPDDADYVALRNAGFADYKLTIDGLVEQPLALSLADLRGAPSRTQITRHDCVEGWS